MAQLRVVPTWNEGPVPGPFAPMRDMAVAVFEFGGSWLIRCNGAQFGIECPADFEPGDTWSSLEPAANAALTHMLNHEKAWRAAQ